MTTVPLADHAHLTPAEVAAVACSDSVQTLVGTWNVASFSDHGTIGTTTGTCIFDAGGTFTMSGTVTYPGEAVNTFDLSGSRAVRADSVDLTIAGETVAWGVEFPNDINVLLTHPDSEGTVVIALHHPG